MNPLGFLGFVGLIGISGFFTGASASFAYFAYLGYFSYFSVPFTQKLKTQAISALALAYLVGFLINLGFITASYLGNKIDYQTGFYVSYSVGSFTFPFIFGILKGLSARKTKPAV